MTREEKNRLHGQIEVAIQMLRQGGFKIGPKMSDALYRMACAGAYAMRSDPDLKRAILTGKPIGENK